ncbi:MAG: hypothetical protein K2X93_05640 [Candidatus Obscuribacterales bacterium]|nr:hypothetical protein [Candidatus Obscuribacterales bacterium]
MDAETSGDLVKISVIDLGRGIPRSMLTQVFHKFMQVAKSDSKRGQGFGLVLSVCKSIMEQHGGKIGVDSEEDRGSTLWFTLPVQNSSCRASDDEDEIESTDIAGDTTAVL